MVAGRLKGAPRLPSPELTRRLLLNWFDSDFGLRLNLQTHYRGVKQNSDVVERNLYNFGLLL